MPSTHVWRCEGSTTLKERENILVSAATPLKPKGRVNKQRRQKARDAKLQKIALTEIAVDKRDGQIDDMLQRGSPSSTSLSRFETAAFSGYMQPTRGGSDGPKDRKTLPVAHLHGRSEAQALLREHADAISAFLARNL